MGAPRSLLDVTNAVPVDDARAVADATNRILETCVGVEAFDRELLYESFAAVADLFAGKRAGYLACDMPYHDLRHSLETALVMARLVSGYQSEHRDTADALAPEYGLLGVLLALLHDTGFIRKASEEALCGAQLMAEHESRSVEFATSYLETTSLRDCAALARLICVTRLASDPDALLAGHEPAAVALGCMLGSADLLSQISDRCYLERCYYHLYPELVLAGRDRVVAADGEEQVLYRDAFDLLSNTPRFYESVVRPRLDGGLRQARRYLRSNFGGADPYAESIERNLDRATRMAAEARPSLLGREPTTTTRNLAAVYRPR
jgi:hypothetical protein